MSIDAIIVWIAQLVMDIILVGGFPGIIVLMTLEGMCLPIPSEIVLAFGGALVSQGALVLFGDPLVDTFMLGLAGAIGCTIGSVLAYYVGMKGGRPFIVKYGRWFHLNEKHLDTTERWFHRYGDWTVFGTRLLPVVRTFISLPAGMAKMKFHRFWPLSMIGSLLWCMALAYLGLILGKNWATVESFYRPMGYVVIIGFVVLLAYCLWKSKTKKKACSTTQVE
ncbi:MAG: DedA family protein [Euryarchaeota archaeon]|nr:DedA family protein [Euryarchaeota archaeon]